VNSEQWSVTAEPDKFNARNIRRDMLPHVRDARKRVPPLYYRRFMAVLPFIHAVLAGADKG